MKLTPPTKNVFYIALLLAVLGILGSFVTIPFVSDFAFWFVTAGYLLLAAGNYFKGF